MQRGDEYLSGHWGYGRRFTIWTDGSRKHEISVGDRFYLYFDYFKNNILKATLGNRYSGFYSHDPYFNFYLAMKITKVNNMFIYFKPVHSTIEYALVNGKPEQVSKNKIANTEFSIAKHNFVINAYTIPFGKRFSYDEEEYRTFYPIKNSPTYRFRIDPIEEVKPNPYLAYGKHYWNEGMSKKGLCFSSFKRNEDQQYITEDGDDTLIFKDIRLTNRFNRWFAYDYEGTKNPHRRSWKENTKKRHQYQVNED